MLWVGPLCLGLGPDNIGTSSVCTIAPLDSCSVLRDESRNSKGQMVETSINALLKGTPLLAVHLAIIIV